MGLQAALASEPRAAACQSRLSGRGAVRLGGPGWSVAQGRGSRHPSIRPPAPDNEDFGVVADGGILAPRPEVARGRGGRCPTPFGNYPFPFFSRGTDPGSRCSPTAVLSQVLAVARGRPACSPRSPWLWKRPWPGLSAREERCPWFQSTCNPTIIVLLEVESHPAKSENFNLKKNTLPRLKKKT